MNEKLSKFFDIDFINTSIRSFQHDIDIEVTLNSGERIRFFIYPDTVDFSLSWYSTTARYGDTDEIDYITSVAKIANKLNIEGNIKNIIAILRS